MSPFQSVIVPWSIFCWHLLALSSFGFSFELKNPKKMSPCLGNILKLAYLSATKFKYIFCDFFFLI